RFGKLYDDAERLFGMEERRLPVVERIVVADDLVAAGARAIARGIQAWHLERDVMDSGTARRDEARHEALRADGLDGLEPATAFIAPRAEAKLGAALHAAVRNSAEHADEKRNRVRDARHAERDVVERDRIHRGSVRYEAMSTYLPGA